jgi:hypothetical protein
MPTPPLSEDRMLEALWAHSEYGYAEGARRLNLNESTFHSRLKKARETFPEGADFLAEIEARVADGFELRGYSQFTKTQAGESIWLKTRKAERDYWVGIQNAIESFDPIDPARIPPLPKEPSSDVIPWLQIGDAHIGMLANEKETGANFDVSIGRAEILSAAFALIDAAPECERMVINDLGDGTHYETFKALTEESRNAVDFDTRYWKMVDAYMDISEAICERALTKASSVDLLYNQGNHSRSNDVWMAAHMRSIHRNNPRVNVLSNESLFIAYRMGKTLVVVHHGDKTRPEKFRDVAVTDFSTDWGETTFRYLDGGHVHHSQRKELAGCEFESWNNLAPMDKHAHDGGWRSKQYMSLVLRSKTYGEIGRHKMPIERVRDMLKSIDVAHYCPPDKRAFSV